MKIIAGENFYHVILVSDRVMVQVIFILIMKDNSEDSVTCMVSLRPINRLQNTKIYIYIYILVNYLGWAPDRELTMEQQIKV